MDGENDTIEVVIEPVADDAALDTGQQQTQERPRNSDGTFKAAAVEPAEDLKAQFEERQQALVRERDAERTKRVAAEREAADARREAETSRSAVIDSQYDSVESGLTAAQAEADAAQQEYKEAIEGGNAAAAAAAQRKMAKAEARIIRLDEAKDEIKTRKAAPAERKPAAEPERRDDGFEKYLSQFSDPTAKWMRGHQDWVTNQRKNAKLNAAHFDAIEAGHEADTDEYFEFVETQIGLRKAAQAEDSKPNGHVQTNGTTRQRKPAVTVAPVNAGGGIGSNGSGGGTSVTLTRGEAAAATDGTLVWNYADPNGKFKKGDPIGHTEMARRKHALQKQGAYDRAYTEQ